MERPFLSVLVALAGLAGCPPAPEEPFVLLADEDESRRATAVLALASRTDSRAHSALRAAVADPSPRVRIAVAGALASSRAPDAAADLGRLLADEVPSVRLAAAEALAAAGGEPARLGLLGALEDPDGEVRRVVRQALIGLGTSGAEQVAHFRETRRRLLVEQSGSAARARRLEAARGLAECGDRAALEALSRLVSDEELDVARIAASGLGRAGSEAGPDGLEAALADPRPSVRAAALDGLRLAVSRPPDGVEARICTQLTERDDGPAAAAVVAVHRLDCDLEPLAARLGSTQPEPALAAAEVLAVVAGSGGGALAVEAAGRLWAEAPLAGLVAVAALPEQPESVAAARVRRDLERYLDGAIRWVPLPGPEPEEGDAGLEPAEQPAARSGEAALARLLARYRPRVPHWVELFPSRDDPREVAGVLTLAAELRVELPRPLVDAIASSGPDPLLRAAAVSALGGTAGDLDDPSPLVRLAAADAMARRGRALAPREKARLAALLPDRDPGVRAAAARALGATGDPAAGPALRAAFERWREPELVVAIAVLGQREAAASLADALGRAVRTSDLDLAEALLLALARIGGPRQADPVLALVDHPSPRIRAAAVTAARAVGGARGRALVEERRGDFSRVVREAAVAPEPSAGPGRRRDDGDGGDDGGDGGGRIEPGEGESDGGDTG